MKIISEPQGRAKEYAGLSLNIYKGCSHGCKYCYIPTMPWVNRDEYYASANPKDGVLDKLKSDIRSLKKKHNGDISEILMSFQGDVYQPAEMELGITREVIKLFIENNIPFTILTKGGTRAVRDFDLLKNYPKARFGTTLIFNNQADSDIWEPNAAPINDRIEAIKQAHDLGIKTWVSVEPVIIPEQALDLIRELHPIVGHWKIGKLNYNKEVESKVDWIKFREDVTALLDSLGADYYLKDSLTKLEDTMKKGDKMTDWLKDCLICNAGLCKTVDKLKAQGLSENKACEQMSEESDGLYSQEAIRSRYRLHTGRRETPGIYRLPSGKGSVTFSGCGHGIA